MVIVRRRIRYNCGMADEVENLAQLGRWARNAPTEHTRTIREIAQKECEADLRAHDALIVRGNTLLTASGVALSIVVGLTKETATINTEARHVLLGLAMFAAILTVFLVVLSMRLRGAETQMNNTNIVGKTINETQDQKLWERDHELSVALAYVEIRMNLSKRHRLRARLLAAAQWTYLSFLVLIGALGIVVTM